MTETHAPYPLTRSLQKLLRTSFTSHGHTVHTLAKASGVSFGTVASLLASESRKYVQAHTLEAVCGTLEIDLADARKAAKVKRVTRVKSEKTDPAEDVSENLRVVAAEMRKAAQQEETKWQEAEDKEREMLTVILPRRALHLDPDERAALGRRIEALVNDALDDMAPGPTFVL